MARERDRERIPLAKAPVPEPASVESVLHPTTTPTPTAASTIQPTQPVPASQEAFPHRLGQFSIFPPSAALIPSVTPVPPIQRKTIANVPGDRWEQEADQMAAQALATDVSQVLPTPTEATTPLASLEAAPSPVPATDGEPLDARVRQFMEPRFGRDFSGVTLHTGVQADAAARSVEAAAFTAGSHVVVRPDLYAPETGEGRKLLAHELAHVVQQTTPSSAKQGNLPLVQREPATAAPPAPAAPVPAPAPATPGATPAPGPGTPTTAPGAPGSDPSKLGFTLPPKPNGEIVTHLPSKVNFSADKEYVHYQLDHYFAARGADLLNRFDLSDDQFKIGYTGSPLDPTTQIPAPDSPQEAYRKKVIATVADEVSTLKAQRSIFEEHFERRANDTLNTMLDKSQEQVEKDKERYGAKVSGWIFKDYSLNNSADTTSLADYAKKLQVKHQKIMEVAGANTPGRAELPGGGAPTGADEENYQKRQAQIDVQRAAVEPLEAEYNGLRREAEQKHPLLAAYQLEIHGHDTPRHLAALANDTGEARAAHVATTINEKLENIEKVRKDASKDKTRVWKLERVVGPTLNLPDVQTRVPLSPQLRKEVVDDKVQSVEFAEEFQNMAIGIVTFALGIIAALPTGGASIGAAVAATTATGAGALVDAALLVQAVKDYQFESAASGTNYDKAQAISQDDPSLFWLAVQFVASAIGAAMAVSEARSMIAQVAHLRSEALGLKAAHMAAEAEMANRLQSQYKQALGDLEKAANEVKPGAGKQLVAEVEAEQNPARVRRSSTSGPDSEPLTPRNLEAPVPNALMHGPDGNAMTKADAYSQYHVQIDKNPNREYGIIRNGKTKEYAVVIGEMDGVEVPAALPMDWRFEAHYHPNLGNVRGELKAIPETNFEARVPSVKDFQGASAASVQQNNIPIMERLDWRDPTNSKTTVYRTTFGYNPGAEKPFWVQFPNEMGGMSPRMEFKSLFEYDTWSRGLTPAGPPTLRNPVPKK